MYEIILLFFQKESKKNEKKSKDNNKSKKGSAPPAASASSSTAAATSSSSSSAAVLADPNEWARLYTKVAAQGEVVRQLKANGASKVNSKVKVTFEISRRHTAQTYGKLPLIFLYFDSCVLFLKFQKDIWYCSSGFVCFCLNLLYFLTCCCWFCSFNPYIVVNKKSPKNVNTGYLHVYSSYKFSHLEME